MAIQFWSLRSKENIYKLQHIVNLLYTGKFAFVVKKPTGAWNDGKMIFAFNRDGFLEPNELYSQNMKISGYSTVFRGDNDRWLWLWIYPKAWSTSSYARNNDIRSYINYLDGPGLDNSYINLFIRQYMERMELLFPGYRKYISEFLKLW